MVRRGCSIVARWKAESETLSTVRVHSELSTAMGGGGIQAAGAIPSHLHMVPLREHVYWPILAQIHGTNGLDVFGDQHFFICVLEFVRFWCQTEKFLLAMSRHFRTVVPPGTVDSTQPLISSQQTRHHLTLDLGIHPPVSPCVVASTCSQRHQEGPCRLQCRRSPRSALGTFV